MQKLIAILFVLLLCSSTLLQVMHLPADAVEQLADGDKCKDAKGEKKEGKEFLAGHIKKMQSPFSAIRYYINSETSYLPRPLLFKPTPPPDVIC